MDETTSAFNGDTGSGMAWMARALQMNDSFYPTGSYAHSFGLEGLIQQGIVHDRATLREYVFASAIPSLRRNDLPLAVHAAAAFAARDWAAVREISILASALKSSRELRQASENVGRQRAELCASIHGHALAAEYVRRAESEGWPFAAPIAAALEGVVLGAPIEAVLAAVYYSSLASLMAAAMKLLRIGQNAAQSLLSEALAGAGNVFEEARRIPLDDIGWFNPWLDIAAARHERAEARLFIS